jgi:predicted nucleic acid-binding protein
VIIADAGPLIALSRVCDLSLLGGLFEQVWITETVLLEQLTASRYFLPSQLLEDILRKIGE